jgi:hypothetical protein
VLRAHPHIPDLPGRDPSDRQDRQQVLVIAARRVSG